ncbi:MAG: transcription termination/antitermination NusG family protein [Ferruginibacter sp.]
MTRNWYAVYTLPRREKKVASLLSRRGIKNYFPVNKIVSVNANNKKIGTEALFNSYVFVYINESEIGLVKRISGIVNFIYWLAKPAVIKWEEIEAVKQLTSAYHNIKLDKSAIDLDDTVRIIDDPVISFNENSASVTFQTLRIVLPSLGYTMIAERDKVNQEKVQKELAIGAFLPDRLNSFFSN